jgi:hypothetical protein
LLTRLVRMTSRFDQRLGLGYNNNPMDQADYNRTDPH